MFHCTEVSIKESVVGEACSINERDMNEKSRFKNIKRPLENSRLR
jgi:hypothetical protein